MNLKQKLAKEFARDIVYEERFDASHPMYNNDEYMGFLAGFEACRELAVEKLRNATVDSDLPDGDLTIAEMAQGKLDQQYNLGLMEAIVAIQGMGQEDVD